MRRILSAAIALAAAFFVLNVPSAVAGGPTSVLLVNYETGRSAAVLNGSAAYAELQSILGDEKLPTSAKPPAGMRESGNATVRMVWLIHDVNPWRVDHVYVQGKDVWVETFLDVTGSDPYARTPIWHQPTRGADLTEALTTLGVVGTGTSAGGSASGVAEVANDAATDPAQVAASTTGAPWWLAAVLGAAGVVLGAVVARRTTPGLRSPRQVTAMG